MIFFRNRYSKISIGFSTHEAPNNFDPIKIAIAKGAGLFERHVGLATDRYELNAYSSTPEQIEQWLQAAKETYDICGVTHKRRAISEKEGNDLRGLKRGVFAKSNLKKGDKLTTDNIFYAIPNIDAQLVSNEFSKYTDYTLQNDVTEKTAITYNDLIIKNSRTTVVNIIKKITKILAASKIALPNQLELELSHHYGIDRYEEYGAAIINCINREYCKN